MIRQLRTGFATAVLLALFGIPVGLLWEAIAPRPKLVIAAGTTVIADPESQAFIAADGWFSVLTGAMGMVCGLVGYFLIPWLKGRLGELALVLGLAAGGLAGALVAWWVGHSVGLDGFEELVRTGEDGTSITGVLDLRSSAAVLVWPLLAVMAFGLLEALDIAQRHPVAPAGNAGVPVSPNGLAAPNGPVPPGGAVTPEAPAAPPARPPADRPAPAHPETGPVVESKSASDAEAEAPREPVEVEAIAEAGSVAEAEGQAATTGRGQAENETENETETGTGTVSRPGPTSGPDSDADAAAGGKP